MQRWVVALLRISLTSDFCRQQGSGGESSFEFRRNFVPFSATRWREIAHIFTRNMSQVSSQEGLDSVSLDELCTDERLRELPDDQLDMVSDHLKQMIPAAFDDAIQRGTSCRVFLPLLVHRVYPRS
jgi:hypothetical protein